MSVSDPPVPIFAIEMQCNGGKGRNADRSFVSSYLQMLGQRIKVRCEFIHWSLRMRSSKMFEGDGCSVIQFVGAIRTATNLAPHIDRHRPCRMLLPLCPMLYVPGIIMLPHCMHHPYRVESHRRSLFSHLHQQARCMSALNYIGLITATGPGARVGNANAGQVNAHTRFGAGSNLIQM